MNMNWGMKIVVGLGSFMIFIVCTVIYILNKDTDTLIDKDYYEKGLGYDAIYDRKQNLQDDHARPTITVHQDTLEIRFVHAGAKGDLNLVRSSDGSLDRMIPLFTTTNVFKLPLNTLTKGNWLLELNWEGENKNYTYNQSIFIP